jgi:hypothetical protein
MSEPALKRLAAGLKLDGFKVRFTAAGASFRGAVQLHGAAVNLRIQYSAGSITEPPRVIVENPELLGPGVFAHLDESHELCVVDRREYVADRYLVAEQARGIVHRAANLLERGLTKVGPLDIAEEFPRHWGGTVTRVHFGPTDGFAKPIKDRTWLEFELCQKPVLAPDVGAVVVQTSQRLSFRKGQPRPNTLGQVLDWAATWDDSLPDRLLDGLAALSPVDPYAIIYAPNGVVGFQVKVSAKGAKVLKTIQQPSTWKTLLRGQFGRNLTIERTQGQRVDTPYILGTNGPDGQAPLAGRNIVLVGCGAIGGFLSVALAQFGAGLGGSLTLIDNEKLDPRNTARHRLGVDKVGLNKAKGCKDVIDVVLPGLSVSALPLKVEQCQSRVLAADLVIDATGEQAIGDLINAWRLERSVAEDAAPAVLHTWVEGNGAAAQTYFSSDPGFGCYRCLQPDLLQAPRFRILRDDADVSVATGCGEAPFSPYGPAAPMAAAALAADHAVDWARGKPKPLLRSIRLSYDETVDRKPTNPSKSEKCPACGGH